MGNIFLLEIDKRSRLKISKDKEDLNYLISNFEFLKERLFFILV